MMRRSLGVAAAVLMVGATFVASANADVRSGRAAKTAAISFRAASVTPTAGFEAATLGDGSVVYVSPRVSFSRDAVAAVTTVPGRGEGTMALSLADGVASRLADADRLAMFVGDRLVSAMEIESLSGGVATVTGLTARQSARLSSLVSTEAELAGPRVTVVASRDRGLAGELYGVDVYVSGVTDLRTYQVTLETQGGLSGTLDREELMIDAERADYVFGTAQTVKAADQIRGRLGAVLFDGSVDAADPVYLGSYTFRASQDASGTFDVRVRLNGDSFLADTRTQRMPFRPINAKIAVGEASPSER